MRTRRAGASGHGSARLATLGPYLAERAWGTARDDYSPGGDAWGDLPATTHWWFLDSTPTHSWMRWRYWYPQGEFPYADLVVGNGRRGRLDPEYELLDTGGIRLRVGYDPAEGSSGLFGGNSNWRGPVLGLVDRDTATHPHFRLKLEAVGYGFLIPVFFVSSGLRFDLDALTEDPSALARVPLFLAVLFAVRFLPALLYRRPLGPTGARVAGLLQATSLPFIVTAALIGVDVAVISPVTGAALVSAGLLSVLVFPPLAVAQARRLTIEPVVPLAPPAFAHRPMGTQD